MSVVDNSVIQVGSHATALNNLVVKTDGAGGATIEQGVIGGGSNRTVLTVDSNGAIPAIKFPATQVSSADANTLDDYEEGTWTPNQGAGLTVVGAFSSSGSYTKVGNKVTVIGKVNGATSVAMAGSGVICTNLPFTLANNGTYVMGAGINAAGTPNVNYATWNTTTLNQSGAVGASVSMHFNITYLV